MVFMLVKYDQINVYGNAMEVYIYLYPHMEGLAKRTT